MDEEMEYAEMLEIPVSTVNVTKKRTRKPKKTTDLKEKVITKVNDSIEPDPAPVSSEKEESIKEEDVSALEEVKLVEPEDNAIISESLPVTIPRRRKRPMFSRLFGKSDPSWDYGYEPELSAAEAKPQEKEDFPIYNYDLYGEKSTQDDSQEKRRSLIVGIEFAATIALCLGIFLTNVFLPNSAINTFFRSMANQKEADARVYTDFKLSAVFLEEADSLTLSPTGILSFQESGCVYPAVNGTVSETFQNTDGTWTVKINHSATFSEVISGLSYLSCKAGSEVRSNVPLGYSDGTAEVQVSMYEDGALLNCFYLTEDGSLAWTEE